MEREHFDLQKKYETSFFCLPYNSSPDSRITNGSSFAFGINIACVSLKFWMVENALGTPAPYTVVDDDQAMQQSEGQSVKEVEDLERNEKKQSLTTKESILTKLLTALLHRQHGVLFQITKDVDSWIDPPKELVRI